MSKKNTNFYFNNFIESISLSCDAAKLLENILNSFDTDKLPGQLAQIHNIEHAGDLKKHELFSHIVRDFITPLERDDITNLSQSIDNVTDSIEDILVHIYINNISSIHSDINKFTNLLIKCCESTKKLLEEFPHYRKSKLLEELIIEINHLEEEGDNIYITAMRNLHITEKDPLQIIAWREIYSFFEQCFDVCEDVANIVESIIISNS